MADKDLKALQKKLENIAREVPELALDVIEVEGTNFIKANFAKQGFQGSSLEKWKPRKTTDKRGRDLTRYRTNRKGKKGALTKFGKRNKGNRPILTGYASAGNKLRRSIKANAQHNKVTWSSYKAYAKRHNEGLDGMPKRQFMGKSPQLEKNIERMLTKQFDKLFKQ